MALQPNTPDSDDAIAEINVTPFVDVVLVLLIIFMITAGVVEFGLEIDVPRTREVATSDKDFAYVNITSKGELFFGDEPVSVYDIAELAKEKNPEQPGIYLRAHRTTPWEIVAPVIAECGVNKVNVNVVTKPLVRDPRVRR
ncbi:MAG: biopolymer transporter ExbD [Bryobacterales bacterium]|nr:biopolymer transporter ExbD [Bryobacterales bacterium]MXY67938.1 biopolymer transporter ExbD [Terriglobia bacterium]MYB51848.1 biopolymer transporter ExbD [Terriglobia bacterium]MYC67834.1 biopolymer transporter ExbD [Terriglobia bacterium]MYG01801.1 biopolymer transporter ExbD [Terriglobia bacterium]